MVWDKALLLLSPIAVAILPHQTVEAVQQLIAGFKPHYHVTDHVSTIEAVAFVAFWGSVGLAALFLT